MAGQVTIFGGSGLVGRQIVRRLAQDGWRVRVAVRHPEQALFLKLAGRVGQVVLTHADIRDPESVRDALAEADAAVNAVGILHEGGGRTFAALHATGAHIISEAATAAGCRNLVHISAIGADKDAPATYARSKAAGETAVAEAFAKAHILRPSLVAGADGGFFDRFAGLAALAPALPLIGGGETRFQPVAVGDVAAAVAACLADAPSGIYEIGGAKIYSFRQLMELICTVIERPRLLVPVPFIFADALSQLTQYLPDPPLTPDQMLMLRHDNVVAPDARGLESLGLTPTFIEAVLPDYLARFRPYKTQSKATPNTTR